MNENLRQVLISLPSLASEYRRYSKCKICGSLTRLFDVVDFNKHCSADPYRYGMSGIAVPYYRCDYCDFTYTDFIDDWSSGDISEFIYNNDYVKVDPDYLGIRAVRSAEEQSRNLAGCNTLRILDYGSGSGAFSKEMSKRGFAKVENYDPFSSPVPPEGTFDICFLFEVIEHVSNPLQTLFSVRDMLSEGGIIIVGQSLQPENISEIRGCWWYIAPRNGHISTYSERTFAIMADIAGLIYYRGSDRFCFAKSFVQDQISSVISNFSRRRFIRLFAGADRDEKYHLVEAMGNQRFRWTASAEISWLLDPFDQGHTSIDIPFLMEIKRNFADRCKVLIDGQIVATKVRRSSTGSGSICAEIGASNRPLHLKLVTPDLETPRIVTGTPDDRLLGLALVVH